MFNQKIDVFFDDVGWFLKSVKNEFDRRFLNIGLEQITVAAARVVELPPRCSKKEGKKRRCL